MLTLFAIGSLSESLEVLVLKHQVCQPDVKRFTIGIESNIALSKLAATVLNEIVTFRESINAIELSVRLRLDQFVLLKLEFVEANIVYQVN